MRDFTLWLWPRRWARLCCLSGLKRHDLFLAYIMCLAWVRRDSAQGYSHARTLIIITDIILNLMCFHGRRKRECSAHLLIFKASFWGWQISFQLIFHWPKQATWLCFISSRKRHCNHSVSQKRRIIIFVRVLMTLMIVIMYIFCFLYFKNGFSVQYAVLSILFV